MLCCRNFYYRFFPPNKFGSRIFSSWRNAPIIFFSQIKNKKNGKCNILFKPQQFNLHNQFCTGSDDSIHSLPVENANSSLTNSSLETNNEVEQKEQQQKYTEGTKKRFENLETRWLELDNKKTLKLKLEAINSGQKYFHIALKKSTGQYINFHNIPVPEDAYLFVHSLDKLINEFAAENFEQKLNIKTTLQSNNQARYKLKLQNVELTGQNHKFRLELLLFINIVNGMIEKEICLQLYSANKITQHKSIVILPLQSLPWLRNQMVEMLTKYDGTEEIGKDAPAQIPQKFFARDVSSPLQGQKLVYKEIWPEFVNNKKPPTLQQYSKITTKIQNSNHIGQQKQNLKRLKMINKNYIEESDREMAELEEGLRALFDFDDQEMIAKIK